MSVTRRDLARKTEIQTTRKEIQTQGKENQRRWKKNPNSYLRELSLFTDRVVRRDLPAASGHCPGLSFLRGLAVAVVVTKSILA